MKKILIPSVILMLLTAGGCVSVRLDYAMNGAGELAAEWRMEARRPAQSQNELLDEGMDFAHDEMSLLASQWESRGIATEILDEDGAEGVAGRRLFTGNSDGAFEELERWLKEDGLTPFSAVTANHLTLDNVEEYYLDATLDWEELIEPSTLASASAELRAAAAAVVNGCEITVSFSLPGRAVEREGELKESGGISTCTVKAAPGKAARIMLHTRVEKDFTPEAAKADPDLAMKWGLVGICGFAGLLMLIIALRCIIKMARYRGY